MRHPAALAQLAKGKVAASVRSIARRRETACIWGEHLNVLDLDSTDRFTEGVMSGDRALRGFKAAMDAALGRGSQALTKWIQDFK